MGKGEPFSGMIELPEGRIKKVILHLGDSESFEGLQYLQGIEFFG